MEDRKCHIRINLLLTPKHTSEMDYRKTVLFFMYLLVAKATCGPVRERWDSDAVGTLKMMHERIKYTLQELTSSPQLPSTPCLSQQFTELVGDGDQTITARHLSSFNCHLLKISELIQGNISEHLNFICHLASDLHRDFQAMETCSLPTFQEHTERYVYMNCLLHTMDRRLSSATLD